jgi:hypothetical protein
MSFISNMIYACPTLGTAHVRPNMASDDMRDGKPIYKNKTGYVKFYLIKFEDFLSVSAVALSPESPFLSGCTCTFPDRYAIA